MSESFPESPPEGPQAAEGAEGGSDGPALPSGYLERLQARRADAARAALADQAAEPVDTSGRGWTPPRRSMIWYVATGDDVAEAQRLLELAGFYRRDVDGADEIGFFGGATETAVRAFQSAAGMEPSGVVDDATWLALYAADPDS